MHKHHRGQNRFWQVVGLSAAMGAMLSSGAPSPAYACGGLFCNAPPPDPFAPLPIAQTGENIVFSVTKTAGVVTGVEAHIQIFYSGPASKFSWIVPVDALPTIGVGSDRMFTSVAAVTQPTFTTDWVTEGTCKVNSMGDPRNAGAPGPSAGSGGSAGGIIGDSGVNVAFRGVVGPFDAAVIKSSSNAELVKWLKDNGYFVADSAVAIIDQYVSENKYFVALKLLNGKDVQAIQPVVLKFAGSEPCVPIRLTAIAAQKDLSINLWVLGTARTVPKNYFEIKLNDARIDWLNGSNNYSDLVKQAANEAGGNAFIAEYAGASSVMKGQLWPNGAINLARLRLEVTPPPYLKMVVSQGLTMFAQTLSLLRQHIPLPKRLADMGVSESEFYNNNQFYWDNYRADFAPFDANKLTDDIDTAVVTPLREGQATFDAQPYLTRLATFLSPEEMGTDPIFIFNDELPTVSNVHKATAHVLCGDQRYSYCEAPVRVEVEGGQTLFFKRDPKLPCGGAFQRGDVDKTPALGIAYQREEVGEGVKKIDNTAAIASALSAHNAVASGTDGCGCSLGGGPMAASAAAALMLALALLRRSRR
jgi:MYXO-CTERM domain-containing protein